MDNRTVMGIDVGTSAVRIVIVDDGGEVVASARAALPPPERGADGVRQDPDLWWQAVLDALDALPAGARASVCALAVDGTSGTLLLADDKGRPATSARMYNDQSCTGPSAEIDALAPETSLARGTGSTLARLLALAGEVGDTQGLKAQHQADWIAGRFAGSFATSDENNALKMGYDVVARRWPAWFEGLALNLDLLPDIVRPGAAIGDVMEAVAKKTGLPKDCKIVAGTTDGVASFLAAGAIAPGTAVSALGTTLTLKTVTEKPIFAPEFGVYSHRLGDLWLAGGASNTGGAVLRQHFDDSELKTLSQKIDPRAESGLDYYPLPASGERFPVNDPNLTPRVEPRPEADEKFLQGLLEGIARIERQAYEKLAELGAVYPQEVLTVGGGAKNEIWTEMRSRILGVPIQSLGDVEPAYGTALLVRRVLKTN